MKKLINVLFLLPLLIGIVVMCFSNQKERVKDTDFLKKYEVFAHCPERNVRAGYDPLPF